jgi:aspartate/methionine/tyrosine aminotransferase
MRLSSSTASRGAGDAASLDPAGARPAPCRRARYQERPIMEISRRGAVESFLAMDVLSAAGAAEAAGADIVRMEVGQPAAFAPQAARDAAVAALSAGPLGYTPALGLPALRERIARLYQERHGVRVPPERIAITSGASGGFMTAFIALFDAGARIAVADPSYPAYRNILKALDLEIVRIEAGPATAFQPDPHLLADAGRRGRVDGVLVASPANPTGSMLSRDAMVDLVEECQRIGAPLISDEIYHGLTFGAPAVSALEITADAIVINSFSKYYCMTGWRIGWMVVPEALMPTIERLTQNLFICAPHVSQVAALAALDCEDELHANVAAYARSRDLLLSELPRAGLDIIAPCDGAFYLYVDASALTNDSVAFCRRMLEEAGVAATPGLDFDPVRGATTVRFSFAGAPERMAEGARRLRTWLGR